MVYKDKLGKSILPGDKVRLHNGTRGIVHQMMDGSIRVTKKPQTGLLGWFKGSNLQIYGRK
jgi:hypothetical protein